MQRKVRQAVRLTAVAAALAFVAGCGGGDEQTAPAPVGPDGTTVGTAAATVEIGVRPDDGEGHTGTFTMSGAIEDTGRFTTVDNRSEGGLDRTFHGEKGKLELHIRLLRVGAGVAEFSWTVRSGTGEYAGVQGEGKGVHQIVDGQLEGALTGTFER